MLMKFNLSSDNACAIFFYWTTIDDILRKSNDSTVTTHAHYFINQNPLIDIMPYSIGQYQSKKHKK
jgi:hypothetical protein